MYRSAHLTIVALGLLMACTPSSPTSEEARMTDASASEPAVAPIQRHDGLSSSRDVIFTWDTPGPAPDCPVCGSVNYLCSFQESWSQGRTFVDPTPTGSRVVGVQVGFDFRDGIIHAPDGTPTCTVDPLANITFKLNGVEVGTREEFVGTCDCNGCGERHSPITWDSNGIPGYVYGGTNTLQMETSATALCIQRVELTIYSELRLLTTIPSSLHFGDQPLGSTTALPLELRNDGDTDFQVSVRVYSGPFVVNGAMSWDLTPGQPQSASISFVPDGCGEFQGSLRTVIGPGTIGSVPLSGRGISQVSLSPGSYDFGHQRVGSSSFQTVTITNDNFAPITLETLSTSGPFSVPDLSLPLTLAPGTSTPFSVRFAPTAPGDVSGGITLTSTPCNGSHTVSLRGTGDAAVSSLSPVSIAFGEQRVGSSSLPMRVTLRATGTADLNIASFAVTGPFSALGLPPRATLRPNQQLAFDVVFSPSQPGVATGSLILQTDAYSGDTALALSGQGVTAILSPSMATLSFGSQRLMTSASQTVFLQNTGTGPVTLQDMSAPAPFSVSGPSLPRLVNPHETLSFQVTFTPDQLGNVSRTLTWVSDASNTPHLVSLEGAGTYASLTVMPTALEFGSQRVETSSPAQTVVLSNEGPASLHLTGLTISPPFSASGFSPPVTLEPGGKFSLQVIFAPTVSGNASGNLTLASDALSPVLMLPLNGTGVEEPGEAPRLEGDGYTCASTEAGNPLGLPGALLLLSMLRTRTNNAASRGACSWP